MKHTLLLLLILNTCILFAAYPPPEKGLKDLSYWAEIPIKKVSCLPSGYLDYEYNHIYGECYLLKYTEQAPHKKDLFDGIYLNELLVGKSTRWAHSAQHKFCLTCMSYCVYGKCGYKTEPSNYIFEQGLTTIEEINDADASDETPDWNEPD